MEKGTGKTNLYWRISVAVAGNSGRIKSKKFERSKVASKINKKK